MPPKRKTTAKQTGQSKKVSKSEVKSEPTRVSKRIRHNNETKEDTPLTDFEEEVKAVVVIKTSTKPLSAIAARKAAMDAGLYKKVEIETSESEESEEEEEEEESREGIEVLSVTDEEDLDLREVMEHEQPIVPISGSTTPNDTLTPHHHDAFTPVLPIQTNKFKTKIPPLMDTSSVSQFKATNQNSCVINQEGETYLFIGLEKGQDIVFMGQVMIGVLFGSVSIAGAILSSGRKMPTKAPEDDYLVSFHPVFSPRTHSLLRIRSEPLDRAAVQHVHEQIEIDEHLMEAVFDTFKNTEKMETIIVIKAMEGDGLEEMTNVVNSFTKNLVKLNKRELKQDESLEINYLDGFQPILELTPGVKAFKEETSWDSRTEIAMLNATHKMQPVVSVVCGAKDMGKSSFCRYFINRLLSKHKRVAYIETDVGQSEFTPSGLISLHYLDQAVLGPAYTHQHLEPERSFFFGSNSPRSDPDHYLACIYELIEHWKQDQLKVQDSEEEKEWIPLIVNTQGWVSGVGYNLLISQIQKLEPTDIFSMRHHVFDYKNLPHTFERDILPVTNQAAAFLIQKEGPSLHYLDCVLQDTNVVTWMDSFTSLQQRDITLASYFHQTNMGQGTIAWDFKTHMVERIPYMIDWRKSLNAIWVIYEEVKMTELFYALNGSVVGLMGDVIDYKKQLGVKKSIEKDGGFTAPKYLNTQDQPSPLPRVTTCYGLGIVRAIDPSQHALLILTPVPKSSLENTSCLIKGELRLPLWMLLDQKLEKSTGVADVPWKKVPYITQERTEGAGANALRVRRNLLRRSQ